MTQQDHHLDKLQQGIRWTSQYLSKYPKLLWLKSFVVEPILQKTVMRQAEKVQEAVLQQVERGYGLASTHQYQTKVNGQDYHIYVAVPTSPPKIESGYPVLYVLDGNGYFGTMLDSLRIQSSWTEMTSVEPMLIVAIGYADADHLYDTLGKRAYDYLPKHHSQRWTARFEQVAPWHQAGGGDQFHDFLVDQLRPALAKRYPMDLNRQSLTGHSFGGFFSLYALLRRPQAFNKYIAISSSIWWDDQRLLNEFEQMTRTWTEDIHVDVMIAVGEQEIPNQPVICEMMLTQNKAMVEKLQQLNLPGLNVQYVEVKGENHQTTNTVLTPEILRFVSQK